MLLFSVNLVTNIYYGKVWNRKLLFLINSTYMCFTKNLFFFNKWLSLVWQGDNDTVIHRDTGHGHGVILGLMLTDWMLLSIIVVKQTPTIVETPTQAHITHWPSLSFILTFHRIALNIYLILRWSCDSILYILLELLRFVILYFKVFHVLKLPPYNHIHYNENSESLFYFQQLK